MRRLIRALVVLTAPLVVASAPALSAQSSVQGGARNGVRDAAAGTAQAPQRLGAFGNWTAATYGDAAGKICYAFTRASRSDGGGARQNVLLTVTHRPQGRDQVSVALGYALPRAGERGSEVEAAVGDRELPFYAAGSNAFAQNGGATVAAFRNGRDAVVKAPGPGGRGGTTDTFSLSGFTAAYEAISRECPVRR